MNQLIARRLLPATPSLDRSASFWDRYANTSSAGSVIASTCTSRLPAARLGVLAFVWRRVFGGSVVLRKR